MWGGIADGGTVDGGRGDCLTVFASCPLGTASVAPVGGAGTEGAGIMLGKLVAGCSGTGWSALARRAAGLMPCSGSGGTLEGVAGVGCR